MLEQTLGKYSWWSHILIRSHGHVTEEEARQFFRNIFVFLEHPICETHVIVDTVLRFFPSVKKRRFAV